MSVHKFTIEVHSRGPAPNLAELIAQRVYSLPEVNTGLVGAPPVRVVDWEDQVITPRLMMLWEAVHAALDGAVPGWREASESRAVCAKNAIAGLAEDARRFREDQAHEVLAHVLAELRGRRARLAELEKLILTVRVPA